MNDLSRDSRAVFFNVFGVLSIGSTGGDDIFCVRGLGGGEWGGYWNDIWQWWWM